MSMMVDFKGWKFLFDKMPNSKEIEAKYDSYVRATEVSLPLATPVHLERGTGPRELVEFGGARVELFPEAEGMIAENLTARGAEVGCTDVAQINKGSLLGLVVDLRENATFAQLDEAFAFLNERVMSLQKCARVIIIGRPTDDSTSVEQAGVWLAVDGFSRALARELGVSGTTVNRIEVSDLEVDPSGVLSYLLSRHSAYVDGQVFRISGSTQKVGITAGARPFEGKVAVVTGASRGIGRATGIELSKQGATVVWVDLPQDNRYNLPATETPIESLVKTHGGKALMMDVAAPDAADKIADVVAELGGADVVVNNAGLVEDAMFFAMPRERWQHVLEANLHAPARIVETLDTRGLLNDGGHLVFISSVAALAGNPGQVNYSASKAGLIGITRYFARKFADRGIRSNAVAAGSTETALLIAVPEWIRAIGVRLNALSQVGQPSDTANLILFLSGDESDGISGECIRCCGAALQGA